MPETTMNENRKTMLRQYDIRPSGEVPAVQSKPIAQPVQHRSHGTFRLGVTTADAGHVPASFFSRKPVDHTAVLLPARYARCRRSELPTAERLHCRSAPT